MFDVAHSARENRIGIQGSNYKSSATASALSSLPSFNNKSYAAASKPAPVRSSLSSSNNKSATTSASSSPEMVDFRKCCDRRINLQARKKSMHFHLGLSHADSPLKHESEIKNLGIREFHLAQTKFFDEMREADHRDLNGDPLIYNPMSVPLGLEPDEPVVFDVIHYLTKEEGRALDPYDRSCHTFAGSDDTLVCNTTELIRRAVGDEIYYKVASGDMFPVAFYHESTLAKLVGDDLANHIMQKWAKDVLSVMLKVAHAIGFASGTAHDSFCELFDFQALYAENPDKFISALTGGSFGTPSHPQSLYDKMRLGAIGTKLKRCETYYNELIRRVNPKAPNTTFFAEYGEPNTSFFEIIDRASKDASSRGGTEKWNRTDEARKRKANNETLQDGDEERIAAYNKFQSASRAEHNKRLERCAAYKNVAIDGKDAVDDKTLFQGMKHQLKNLNVSITNIEKSIESIPETMRGGAAACTYRCKTCGEQTHLTRVDSNGEFIIEKNATCNSIGCTRYALPREEGGHNDYWTFVECLTVREWRQRVQSKKERLETDINEQLLRRIRNFLKREASNGGPTTQELLKEFDDLPDKDAEVFRQKLKSISKRKNGKWILRS